MNIPIQEEVKRTPLTNAIEPSDAGYFAQLDREYAQKKAQEEWITPLANALAKPRPFLSRIPENGCAEIFDDTLQAIYGDEKKQRVLIRRGFQFR